MGTARIPPEGDPNAADQAIRTGEGHPSRLTPADPGYPSALRSLPLSPVVYSVGPWNLGNSPIAIVGSREANGDGRDFAAWLAGDLAARGFAILSGLASGIDAAAHRGALEAGGCTGAVLGTSLDECYPPGHGILQRAVADSLGLLTEVPPGSPPTRVTFARRNRILAALADAVVVVQGDAVSGALLTAKAATRLGRPVGAVPWDPRERMAEAPLALLKEKGATLIRNADDVLAMIEQAKRRPSRPVRPHGPKAAPAGGAAERPAIEDSDAVRWTAELDASRELEGASPEGRLLGALRYLPQPLESAARNAGLGIAEAGAAFVQLEIEGRARREPGGRVRRLRAG